MASTQYTFQPRQMTRGAVFGLLGSFISMFMMAGVVRTYGLLHEQLMGMYHVGPAEAAWVAWVFAVCITVSPILAGYTVSVVDTQLVIIVAGITGAAGFAITAFSSSLHTLFWSFGVLIGASSRFVMVAVLTFINTHYHGYQLFTNGLIFIGCTLGGMSLVQLLPFLEDTYTSRGTFLLFGGIWLHICIGGMLLNDSYFPTRACTMREVTQSYKTESVKDETTAEATLFSHKLEGPYRRYNCCQVLKKSFTAWLQRTAAHVQKLTRPVCTLQFICVLASWFGIYTNIQCFLIYLPLLVMEQGYSSRQVANLLALMNLCEMVARPLVTVFGDSLPVTKHVLFLVTLTLSGLILVLLPSLKPLPMDYALMVTQGVLGESLLILIGFTVTESVGRANVGMGTGAVTTIIGLAWSFTALLIGYLAEQHQTYVYLVYVAGIGHIFAALTYMASRTVFKSFQEEEELQ